MKIKKHLMVADKKEAVDVVPQDTEGKGNQPSVVIIGAGLAGIAAGVALAGRGIAATVIETRKRLGGRAGSFVDPASGAQLDNCQHVVMRSCTALLDLYDKLGVSEKIQWHKRFYFIDGQGHLDTLTAGLLPAPFHLAPSLLRFKGLSFKEKWAISRGMLAIILAGKKARASAENISFGAWLGQHGQIESVIKKFWLPIIVSACNQNIDQVPLACGLQVFQDGFLCNRHIQEMGVSTVPLQELYEPAKKIIESAGGKVITGISAASLEFADGQVTALHTSSGKVFKADQFISTVPFDRLNKLVTKEMVEVDSRLQHLNQFEVSPIIGIHLYFECSGGEKIMNLPHVALTDSPLQWVFNKGVQDDCQHLHGVISAAFDWVDKPTDEIARVAADEIKRLLPGGGSAVLRHHKVVKEKRATFALKLGVDQFRPKTSGAIENLVLAGDWTATGWPATMEGAVRSGYSAAKAV